MAHTHNHNSHNHHHGHHHDHHHGALGEHTHESVKRMRLAFALNFTFAIIELAGGLITGSVSVLSGALHDLGDSLAIGLAVFLERRSRHGSNSRYSYGFRRLSLLSALVTSIIMVVGSLLVFAKAVPRIVHPESVRIDGMLGFALLGIAVNGFAAWRMSKGDSLNERVISWHLIEDLLGWVSILAISVVMRYWDWPILDSLLAVLIALYVLRGVLSNLKSTVRLFLQAAPEGIDIDAVRSTIRGVPLVADVHDIHLWSLDGESHVMTLHVVVNKNIALSETRSLKAQIRHTLSHLAKVHVTIEIEHSEEACPEINCVGS